MQEREFGKNGTLMINWKNRNTLLLSCLMLLQCKPLYVIAMGARPKGYCMV
jgi:hypothetical protein